MITFLKNIRVLFLSITSIIFICCKDNAQKLLLDIKIDEQTEFLVAEIEEKYNEQGELQCEKYFNFSDSIGEFKIYGGNLTDIISTLYNTEKRNIICKSKNCEQNYSLTFKGIRNKKNDSIIIKSILEKNNSILTIKPKEIDGFKMSILSNNKLKNSNTLKESKIFLSDYNYILENANFLILNKFLSSKYNINVTNNMNQNDLFYDFTIPANLDNEEVLKYLKEEYDIILKRNATTIDTYIIVDNKSSTKS